MWGLRPTKTENINRPNGSTHTSIRYFTYNYKKVHVNAVMQYFIHKKNTTRIRHEKTITININFLCILCISRIGLGVCCLVVITFVTIYYMIIIAWIIFYFVASFLPRLGWGYCDHEWNSDGMCSQHFEELLQSFWTHSHQLSNQSLLFSNGLYILPRSRTGPSTKGLEIEPDDADKPVLRIQVRLNVKGLCTRLW